VIFVPYMCIYNIYSFFRSIVRSIRKEELQRVNSILDQDQTTTHKHVYNADIKGEKAEGNTKCSTDVKGGVV